MERDTRDRLGDVVRVHLPGRQQPTATSQSEGVVTLTTPRPDLERAANEYVETPLRPTKPPLQPDSHPTTGSRHHHHPNRAPASPPTSLQRSPGSSVAVIVKQPHKETHHDDGQGSSSPNSSIICRDCGKCRCKECKKPRSMPKLWLCDNFCLCSAETCVDYASCLCCVKAAMYHCGGGSGDDDEICAADDPCSCAPYGRTSRWTCLAVATLFMPCLCLYWPLRYCAKMSECCYASCSRKGCTCHSNSSTCGLPLEKRLLRSSPEL